MSAIHGAARRLAGLLNDAQDAGVEIYQHSAMDDEWFEVIDSVKRLTLTVERDQKTHRWEVRDA